MITRVIARYTASGLFEEFPGFLQTKKSNVDLEAFMDCNSKAPAT